MAVPKSTHKLVSDTVGDYKYGFSTKTKSLYKSPKGLTKEIIEQISKYKNEPKWMLEYRLKALEIFNKKPMQKWGADLSDLDFNNIRYYIRPQDKPKNNWDEVPPEIKDTFDKLGIPEAEKKFLAGTGAQFESEMIYHNLLEDLQKQGIIFESTDVGLQKYPEIFKKFFGTVIPATDNKFAALNSAVWSGGSFIYVPKGVHIDLPLQAYYRINAENMGQFERTLIIADEGSSIHYIEGCTAPIYSTDSLHSAVVEIIVKKDAKVQYSTVQNWSGNIYNLVTKRAKAYKNAEMKWLDCNIGSKATMKYPAVYLMEEGAYGEVQSLAFAGEGQNQDTGAKMYHFAPRTTSKIIAKSISKGKSVNTFRGIVKITKGSIDAKTHTSCDALMLSEESISNTHPSLQIEENQVQASHEATVGKVGEEQLFYLMSRGLSEEEATSLIVNGFAMPIIKQLPMEYAIELNRLIDIEMTGAVG